MNVIRQRSGFILVPIVSQGQSSQATAYIMSAEDCHKIVRRVRTCVKFSTNKAEGDQFALLHKLCFPAAEMRSRNRSGQRKAGMLRLLPVNQYQGTAAGIRLAIKDAMYQRLVC